MQWVVQGLGAQNPLGLQSSVSTPEELDWSVLFEPPDTIGCPSVITLKALGLPDDGEPACNLLLISLLGLIGFT